MKIGLQTYSPTGELWFDTSDRSGKVVGDLTLSNNQVANVGLANMGTPYTIIPNPTFDSWSDSNGNSFSAPFVASTLFQNSGNTLTVQFSFSTVSNPSAYLYYGVY